MTMPSHEYRYNRHCFIEAILQYCTMYILVSNTSISPKKDNICNLEKRILSRRSSSLYHFLVYILKALVCEPALEICIFDL
jgi:hypothetical protein